MITLKIDENTLFLLKKNYLSVEEFFVLSAILLEQKDLLNSWDNQFFDKSPKIVYQDLLIKGFLNLQTIEENDFFSLTDKGIEFFKNLP